MRAKRPAGETVLAAGRRQIVMSKNRELFFIDRRRDLFGRCGRERRRRTGPLRLRIRMRGLRRRCGRARAAGLRLGGWSGLVGRRSLRHWCCLRHPLRLARAKLGKRQATDRKSRRNHDRGKPQIPRQDTFPLIGRHGFDPAHSSAQTTIRADQMFLLEPIKGLEARRCLPRPQTPATCPWRSRRVLRPAACHSAAPEFPRRLRDGP